MEGPYGLVEGLHRFMRFTAGLSRLQDVFFSEGLLKGFKSLTQFYTGFSGVEAC